MWKQKLCIALGDQFRMDYEEQFKLIKKVGFDGFFIEWNDKMNIEK